MANDPVDTFLQDIRRSAFDAIPLDVLSIGESDTSASLYDAWNKAYLGIIGLIFEQLTADPGKELDPADITDAQNDGRIAQETGIPDEKLIKLARGVVEALLRYGAAHGAASIRNGGKTFILFRTDPGRLRAELAA